MWSHSILSIPSPVAHSWPRVIRPFGSGTDANSLWKMRKSEPSILPRTSGPVFHMVGRVQDGADSSALIAEEKIGFDGRALRLVPHWRV